MNQPESLSLKLPVWKAGVYAAAVLCVAYFILDTGNTWVIWDQLQQWHRAVQWWNNPHWIPHGTSISGVGNNGSLLEYFNGILIGSWRSEWAGPVLSTLLALFALFVGQRCLERSGRNRQEAILISLVVLTQPMLWRWSHTGFQFAFLPIFLVALGFLLPQQNKSVRNSLLTGLMLVITIQIDKSVWPAVVVYTLLFLRKRSLVERTVFVALIALLSLPMLTSGLHAPSLDYGTVLGMMLRSGALLLAPWMALWHEASRFSCLLAVFLLCGLPMVLVGLWRVITRVRRVPSLLLWTCLSIVLTVLLLSYTTASGHHLMDYLYIVILGSQILLIYGVLQVRKYAWRCTLLVAVVVAQISFLGTLSTQGYRTGVTPLLDYFPLHKPEVRVVMPNLWLRDNMSRQIEKLGLDSLKQRQDIGGPLAAMWLETGWYFVRLDAQKDIKFSELGERTKRNLVKTLSFQSQFIAETVDPRSRGSSRTTGIDYCDLTNRAGLQCLWFTRQKTPFAGTGLQEQVVLMPLKVYKTSEFPITLSGLKVGENIALIQPGFPLEFMSYVPLKLDVDNAHISGDVLRGYALWQQNYKADSSAVTISLPDYAALSGASSVILLDIVH